MSILKRKDGVMQRRLTRASMVLGVLALPMLVIAVSGMSTRLPGEQSTSNGFQRNQAFYLPMRDGVRIAVDLWLPAESADNERLPAVMQMTRYWRAHRPSFLTRALMGLKLMDPYLTVPPIVQHLNAEGYAVAQVDARGSGASFGHRVAELSPDEIEDYGQVVDWIVAQPWSNGNVGSVGVSYDGITAERLASTGRAAVKAVVPLYADFDFQLGVLQPGGASLDFVELWSRMVGALDRNDVCAANGLTGAACWKKKLLWPGVKPVDADDRGRLLAEALMEHRSNLPLVVAFKNVEFRDDRYGETDFTMSALNTYGHVAAIEKSGIPMQIWLGWLDAATVNGGLSRYLSVKNPQEVIIGPFSHGGEFDTDPFAAPKSAVMPSVAQQYAHMTTFLDRFMKVPADPSAERSIKYYTMGARHWCQTATWPPAFIQSKALYFDVDGRLGEAVPATQGADPYRVDFTHTTGSRNRWFTNLDYGDVVYADRDAESAKLLNYVTKPLDRDVTITGSALLTLYAKSSEPDVVFHAYLEALPPDGPAVHLAEAVLRSVNYALVDAPAPSELTGPPRSYLRADAKPLPIGEVATVKIAFTPTSARIPAGYRLRLSLGGADESIFVRRPASATPSWEIQRGTSTPSHVVVPIEGPGSCRRVQPF